MKKLNAFTLAEVLIVIAIIGIIATLTLPTLNNNIMKNMAATGLAKAINDLESANKLFLEQNHLRNLTEHLGMADTNDQFRYFNMINAVMPLTRYDQNYTYNRFAGNAYGTSAATYTGKDGITYTTRGNIQTAQGTVPDGYSGQYFQVIVDVNGSLKGPNNLGKDVFNLDIDTKGNVIPEGSRQYAMYVGNNNALWEGRCIKQNGGPSDGGVSCAGAIVDNGYKVLYY